MERKSLDQTLNVLRLWVEGPAISRCGYPSSQEPIFLPSSLQLLVEKVNQNVLQGLGSVEDQVG